MQHLALPRIEARRYVDPRHSEQLPFGAFRALPPIVRPAPQKQVWPSVILSAALNESRERFRLVDGRSMMVRKRLNDAKAP
jgi:hypothetical protein